MKIPGIGTDDSCIKNKYSHMQNVLESMINAALLIRHCHLGFTNLFHSEAMREAIQHRLSSGDPFLWPNWLKPAVELSAILNTQLGSLLCYQLWLSGKITYTLKGMKGQILKWTFKEHRESSVMAVNINSLYDALRFPLMATNLSYWS
jgi:hypothetical protein